MSVCAIKTEIKPYSDCMDAEYVKTDSPITCTAEIPDGATVIKAPPCFDLTRTLECGQCFRFDFEEHGCAHITVGDKFLRLRQTEDGYLIFYNTTANEYEGFWKDYFNLETDYTAILEYLSSDVYLSGAIKNNYGIRILKQPEWETLCSFIISQNNNIPRIKKIIASLCREYGNPIPNTSEYSFPTPEAILSRPLEELDIIKSGFRARYIYDAALKTAEGDISFDLIKNSDYAAAEAELLRIKGVGKKVAACTLLYGFGFIDAFPLDVWMKRVLERHYTSEFSPDVFSPYAGIAQQYLFAEERK